MGGGDVEMNMSEPIPHAYAELYLHTMTRGAQVGGLASLVLAPTIQLYRKVRGPALWSSIATASVVGSVLGAGFIAVGTHQKVQHDSFDAVYDRAYRLRYNRGQVLVDSISYSLAGAGLVLGTVVMNRGVMGGLAGLSLGLSLGPLVYAGAKAGKVIE